MIYKLSHRKYNLSYGLLGKAVHLWLNGVENPLAKQRKTGSAIHGPFDELQFGHLSLDLAVVDGPSEARFHVIVR